MAFTMTGVNPSQAIMTDRCITEVLAGGLVTTNTFKLVLLNLGVAATGTLSQSGTAVWSDLSNCETDVKSDGTTAGPLQYTKGTGITLGTPTHTAISSNMAALDFAPVSLDNADFKADAWAIVRSTGTLGTSPVLAMGRFDAAKTPSGTGTANFTAAIVNPIKFTAGAAA
jgi:hypothetical protein